MDKIIKDGGIVKNFWQLIGAEEATTNTENSRAYDTKQNSGKPILSIENWRQWDASSGYQSAAMESSAVPGLWIEADQDLDEIEDIISRLPIVAVRFPSIGHGVGFSVATVLREHYKFSQELRAFGSIIPDQVPYLRRCGFNSFVLANQNQLDVALNLLLNNNLTYQGSVFSARTPFQFRYQTPKP